MDAKTRQLILGVVAVGAAFFLGSRLSHEAAGQDPARAQGWEYKIVDVTRWIYTPTGHQQPGQVPKFSDGLNEMGSQGWEYTGPASPGNNNLLVFKRPKR